MRSRCSSTGPGRRASACALDEQTAPLVVSICRRLDGMPLAIELAAARLRSLSLSDLYDRLDQRFRPAHRGKPHRPGRGSRPCGRRSTGPTRCSTGAEQLLLRRLSVFAEGFDLDAAEAVCGFGDIDAFDVAGLLGLAGGQEPGRGRAGRAGPALPAAGDHPPVRRRAPRRGRRQEAAAVAAAHCAHFLSVAETAAPHLTGPDQGSWLARLDADQANLRRAAEHAAADPDGTAQVLRFGVALWRYWARSRNEKPPGCSCRCSAGPKPPPTPRCSPKRWSPPELAGSRTDPQPPLAGEA